MSKQDYYTTLGVQKNADFADIKKSYRKLAMKYHPDRNADNPESEKKFKEVSEAYEILKDEQKRAAYDRYGHAAFENGGMGSGASSGGGFGGGADFSDIFSEFFGGGGGRGRSANAQSRGSDLRYNLNITLEEAYKGIEKNIKFSTAIKCDTCDGTGSKSKSKPATCGVCRGAGVVRMQQGFFTVEKTCSHCNGSGVVIKDPCGSCSGQGRINKQKTLTVNIPQGIEDNTRMRLSGEGEIGARGGQSGDLYIFITIEKHSFFIREGNDIHCQVPIKMTTATLGGEVEVPVIDGSRAIVTIPEGTQSGDKLRLKGKGMAVMKGGGRRGNMYIHSQVEMPVKLNKRQKELLQEFEEEDGKGCSPRVDKFFKKVKELWKDLKD